MPHIKWIEEPDATGDLAAAYAEYFKHRPERAQVADILKCFSLRPDFLKQVMDASWTVHFSDGHLDRRTKEMIATYVSGLNQCPY